MAELCGIVADLDLCVGCYACEVACKQENNVPIGTRWIRVTGVGPEELDGRSRIDFVPVMTDECTLCEHRLIRNQEPRCVDNCPTQALKFCGNPYEVLKALHSGRRVQMCKVKSEVMCYV